MHMYKEAPIESHDNGTFTIEDLCWIYIMAHEMCHIFAMGYFVYEPSSTCVCDTDYGHIVYPITCRRCVVYNVFL